jgi:hypothetical protein
VQNLLHSGRGRALDLPPSESDSWLCLRFSYTQSSGTPLTDGAIIVSGNMSLHFPYSEAALYKGSNMRQIYMITYPTGKIYIGKDTFGSYRYFGCPDIAVVNADFQNLPEEVRRDYTVRKQILWESETASLEELSIKEVEFIRQYQSNNPAIGYNRWPKPK